MKSVILTGASGFLGRNLPPKLLPEFEVVHTIGRSSWPGNNKCVDHHPIDLLSSSDQSLDQVFSELNAHTLVHSAWYTEPGGYWTSVENLRWLSASLRMFEAFVRSGGKRVVVVGTCAEYDWRHQQLDEVLTPLLPSTVYGEAKASLHKVLQAYASTHGISFAWAHIFFPFGPHEKRGRLLSEVAHSLLSGSEIPVSTGTQIRDFMHIEDAAAAVAALAKSDVVGGVNIASGDPRSLRNILEIFSSALGRPELVNYGGRPPIQNDPPALTASVRRLREEVKFQSRYTLEDGLETTAGWWRKHLRLPLGTAK